MSTPPPPPSSRPAPGSPSRSSSRSSSRQAPAAAARPAGPPLRLPAAPDPRGARAFAGVAEAFERGRPGYAEAALRWISPGERLQVLDVGAGTGKLSRGLLGLGHTVTAVEPVPEMLEQLREAVPGAHPVRARAESIPVVSRSVDVVLAADSFQWFDAGAFLAEATRVLRPGGVLALLWNQPDVRVPWVRRLARLLGDDHLLTEPVDERLPLAAVDDTGQFESVEQGAFRLWQRLRKAELRDLVACRPDVVARGPVAVDRLLVEVDELFADAAAGSELSMPLVTHAFRAAVLPWAYVGAPRLSRSARAAAPSATTGVPPTSAEDASDTADAPDAPDAAVEAAQPTDDTDRPGSAGS